MERMHGSPSSSSVVGIAMSTARWDAGGDPGERALLRIVRFRRGRLRNLARAHPPEEVDHAALMLDPLDNEIDAGARKASPLRAACGHVAAGCIVLFGQSEVPYKTAHREALLNTHRCRD